MNSTLNTRLRTLWVSPEPAATEPFPSRVRTTAWDHIGNSILWPLAMILVAHRLIILSINGDVTDDFSTVYYALRRFIEGVPVYNENYHHVDPHYLYSPGATLLLSPLGFLGHFGLARLGFIGVNALAIILAIGLLTRMFGFSLRSFVWPLSISLAFLTESVRSTLIFSNINGILLLALCGYFFLLLRDKQWWAGVVIGVAILIKPLFLPLLFLPLVKLQWRAIVVGLVVPVLFNLAALPLIKDVNDYSERLLPYLGQTRDYFNSSLPGIALYYGMPTALKLMLFAVFATAVAVGVIMLLRWRYSDPLFWMTTTSTLLLSGVFFLSSLGQMYYSMMFFPMMFTVVLRKSVLHSWVAWVAVYCFFSPDSWVSHRWYAISRWTAFTLPTVGWGLLILVIATAAATWWWNERRSEG